MFQVVAIVISKTQKQEQLAIRSGSGKTRSVAGAECSMEQMGWNVEYGIGWQEVYGVPMLRFMGSQRVRHD